MNKSVEAIILDWAGTVVDFGSFAPTQIFVDAFAQAFNFKISLQEARGPMGMGKIDHIRTLFKTPNIRQRWVEQLGYEPNEENVQQIYHTFMPLQIAQVVHFAKPIEGALDAITMLKSQGIKVGSCSGYPKAVMDVLAPKAAEYGYQPDCIVVSDEIAAGSRPGPWMALKNVIELGIMRVAHCVKVDDAVTGIAEGSNAGMWTVGLSVSGNEFGATFEQYQAMSRAEIDKRKQIAEDKLRAAGAHYIIETLAELPTVIAHINQRLENNETP